MEENADKKESTWKNMSKEEKSQMMKEMMESFFSEKGGNMKQFMKEMMNHDHKSHGCGPQGMMGKMMGGRKHKSSHHPMMEMMKMMMGEKGESEGFNPMDMCGHMMSMMKSSQRVSTLATPEVQGLFEDWVEQIEDEIIELYENEKSLSVSSVAEHFKISKDSAYYFLTKLAQKGKIDLEVVEKEDMKGED